MRPGAKRLLGRILLVAALAAPVLVALERHLVLAIHPPEEARFRRARGEPTPVRDVILGPSHAAHGIDPRAFDPDRTFDNLGLDGAGPGYLVRFYALMRRHQAPPRRAILVVPSFSMRRDCFWRRFEDDAAYITAIEAFELARDPATDLATLVANRFAFLRFHPYLIAGVPPGLQAPESWTARGFQPYPGQRGGAWTVEAAYSSPADPAREGELDGLLAMLERDGVRTVIVQAPLYRPIAGVQAADDARIAAIAAAHGVPVRNYHADPAYHLGEDRSAFWDWNHLNAKGSQAFSRRLAVDLRATGFLRQPPASEDRAPSRGPVGGMRPD